MYWDRSLAIICFVVVAIHGGLLFLSYDGQFLKKFETSKPVARLSVQTISLESHTASDESPTVSMPAPDSHRHESSNSTKDSLASESDTGTKDLASVSTNESPKPQKPIKKKPQPKKKEIKKPKKSPSQTNKKNNQTKAQKKPSSDQLALKQKLKQQQKLLDKAQKSIAKIGKKDDKTPSQTPVTVIPGVISNLQIDTLTEQGGELLNDQEINYRDELAARLKLGLRLPEYGEVRLKLTLGKTGNVVKLAIVNAESKINQQYIEKTLPSLRFPALGSFGGGNEYTFSITLSNE